MRKMSSSVRKSRKQRRQWWIVAVTGLTMLAGLFFGSALDANLLTSAAQGTQSFEEGWKPFQNHLHQVSTRSAWIGLLFLILAGFALPRAQRVARRYFQAVRVLQPKPGLLLLTAIFLISGVSGFFLGKALDHFLTALNVF